VDQQEGCYTLVGVNVAHTRALSIAHHVIRVDPPELDVSELAKAN
jgi:hypothetical protein